MKKLYSRLLLGVWLLTMVPCRALAADLLVPVGRVVGLELQNNTVTVVSFEKDSRARAAGVEVGDRLLRIDDVSITSAQDVRTALERSSGTVVLTLQRGDRLTTVRTQPTVTAEGPRLGMYLRQGITGIGTVTYYDPQTGQFGALGHGVNDPSGQLLQLTAGNAFPAGVTSVRKGKSGDPGQLMGTLTDQTPLGILERNTAQGIFGKLSAFPGGQPLPVGSADTVRTGPATILSNINGDEVREYTIEIAKIFSENPDDPRDFMIRVTDRTLLEATGGVVQGMSGSPILQNGKLVGAVTHVLVNDPTRGYAISAERMLDAAS